MKSNSRSLAPCGVTRVPTRMAAPCSRLLERPTLVNQLAGSVEDDTKLERRTERADWGEEAQVRKLDDVATIALEVLNRREAGKPKIGLHMRKGACGGDMAVCAGVGDETERGLAAE